MEIIMALLFLLLFTSPNVVSGGGAGKGGDERKALLNKIQIMENSMQRTKVQLEECYKKLENKPESVLGQAMNSLGTCFSSSPEKSFKPFVTEILKLLDIKEESKSEISRTLQFTANSQDIQTLRRFVMVEDVRFHEIQEILLSSLENRGDTLGSAFNLDTILAGAGGKLHPNHALLLVGGLVLFVILLPLCLGTRKRVVFLMLTCLCIVHVWLGEYWKAVAKKEATLAKLGPNMKSCRLEKRGYAQAVSEFFTGLFNGVDDPCEEYYRAAMVDPIFEVNLLTAFVESISQLLGILGGLGKAVGNFFTNFLAPLPLAWKIPGLIILIVLAMILSGYQIRTLVFSIGPSKERSKTKRLLSKSKKSIQKCTDDDDSTQEESDHETRKSRKKLPSVRDRMAALPYPVTEKDIFEN
eukprot:TRINITY_DN4939_c0_g1_i8.p1 TRINITY_DN4939_c0_g1~~TRINITY_DN4939_c0_g1_i8.p1  ORF type:complete len:412 (-),score=58.36 TRINITY_DN4939_c0_g1_i8:802-2037(-)